MALYRCAACGSSHVVGDTKKEEFSVSKAVFGTALFGSLGALMGVKGKAQMYYHCAACGQVLSYTMSETQKGIIDYALEHKHMRRYVEDLDNLKKQYAGIEWSEDDSRNAQKKLNSQVNEITDKITLECVEFLKQKSCTSHDELVAFLTNLGYGQTIICKIKDAIAAKDDIPIKFVMQDDKLSHELCYDKTGDGIRPLGHYNRIVLRNSKVKKKTEQELEQERKKWEDTNNELVNMLASELLKHNEPITVLTMMIRNESLAMYSNQKLSGMLNSYSKECGFKKTIIDGKEYWSL